MNFIKKVNISLLTLAVLIGFCVFLRWYQIEERNQFTWDQVDNAWAAKTILIDHELPIEGMQAKLNSGLFIGPLYYYYIVPFYAAFNLDPVASGYIAISSSVISLIILYYVTKSIFSYKEALIAGLLYVFLTPYIEFDRVQWPVNFVPAISLVIFYSIYRILNGSVRYFFLLMLALGISFHLHMTSIFYIFILVLCIPLLPRKRETVKYFFYSLPIFIIFISPIIYMLFGVNHFSRGTSYASSSYHGFYVRRMLQLSSDAFLEFATLTHALKISVIRFLLPLIFIAVYLKEKINKKRLIICYLVLLWVFIPWILLSTYSGELTVYYFIIPRFIAVMLASYIIVKFVFAKNTLLSLVSSAVLGAYLAHNVVLFFQAEYDGISYYRQRTLDRMEKGEQINFQQGAPESYIYFYYTHDK